MAWRSAIVFLVLLGACRERPHEVLADAAAALKVVAWTEPAGDRVGVEVCDEYLDRMAVCITRVGAEAAEPMKNAMDDSRKAWRASARTPDGRAALATTCAEARDAAKSAAAAMGCDW
jgi:hypothetical protein